MIYEWWFVLIELAAVLVLPFIISLGVGLRLGHFRYDKGNWYMRHYRCIVHTDHVYPLPARDVLREAWRFMWGGHTKYIVWRADKKSIRGLHIDEQKKLSKQLGYEH